MATIVVRIAPLTVHVRTARLIALAVARRSRVDEEILDEVRLAVGETCSRAVNLHLAHGYADPVQLRMTDDQAHFSIEVINRGTLADGPTQAMDLGEASARALEDDQTPPGFELALVSGLVDDMTVTNDEHQTTVRMQWTIVSAGTEALGKLSAS